MAFHCGVITRDDTAQTGPLPTAQIYSEKSLIWKKNTENTLTIYFCFISHTNFEFFAEAKERVILQWSLAWLVGCTNIIKLLGYYVIITLTFTEL